MMDVEQAGFQDYTISSTFERFVSGLENILGSIRKGSTSKIYAVEHGFPFRKEPYTLTYLPVHEAARDSGRVLQNYAVKYHEWFIAQDCVVLEPESYSRRILSTEEYHTIVSAVSVALDNLMDHSDMGCACPVYIPMHDALRDAYGGIRKMKDGSGNVVVQCFECDSVHGRVENLSKYLSDVKNRLMFLSDRVQCHDSTSASICAELAESCVMNNDYKCWTKKTYHVYRHEAIHVEYKEYDEGWDVGMPWMPWVNQDDPIGGVEIDILYNDWDRMDKDPQSAVFLDDVVDGSSWRIFAMDTDHAPDTGDRSFLTLQVADTSRKFLTLIDVEHLSYQDIMKCESRMSGKHSFCAKLHSYVEWYSVVKDTAEDVQSLTTDSWWMEHAEVFDQGIRSDDIENLTTDIFMRPTDMKKKHASHRSLFEHFSLNATIPDSLRGIAQLWLRLLEYLRHEYLDKKIEIPFMEDTSSGSHLRHCSIVRALARLNYCIILMTSDTQKDHELASSCINQERFLDINLLDYPDIKIKVPMTQTIPSDILETDLGRAEESRDGMYKAMLLSDMQAFKAANDGCRFEDFIRWYSPRDWIESNAGGTLSKRMMGDSAWTDAWKSATPIHVSSQKTLFNPSEEAERIMQQLFSIKPVDLISQMSFCLFSAACYILKQSESKVVQRQVDHLVDTAGRNAEWFSALDSWDESRNRLNLHGDQSVVEHDFGLFNALSCIEHCAAATASLNQRLSGMESVLRTELIEGMLQSAMNGAQGYELDRLQAESLATCDTGEDNPVSFDGPIAIEHSISIQTDLDGPEKHRLYVNRLSREIRVATSITLP